MALPQPTTAELTPQWTAGGSKELIALAAPLVLSQSFMTVQIFVDTLLLSWHDSEEMAASFPAVMWFWVLFAFPQVTAGYTSTFVAQYIGAGRPARVGPAVWQGLWFAVGVGLMFVAFVPFAPGMIALAGHDPASQVLQGRYLHCLCFAAPPMLLVGAVNGFFSGRGQTWVVLLIEAIGTAVNVGLAWVMIPGRFGVPEMGIEGAGWATVAGSWVSAVMALGLLLRPRFRNEFGTLSGWRPDLALFGRLMRYGGPAGAQIFLDAVVFNLFTQLVGGLGEAEMGATTLTVRFNMVAFLPMLGLGQAVSVLVGRRLGEDRPEVAQATTYTGLGWAFAYMCLVAAAYLLIPGFLVSVFEGGKDPDKFAAIAAIVPTLLAYVAVYSVADSANLIFAFALRGAGDTRFVTILTFALAWPVMVIPTWVVVYVGGGVYWCWVFATAHIIVMSVCFWLRFRTGKWKTMRVIEPAVAVE